MGIHQGICALSHLYLSIMTRQSGIQRRNTSGTDTLSIQHGSVKPGDRVLLIDDLMATGGTVEAGIQLIKQCGGQVVECGVIIELLPLNARQRIEKVDPSVRLWSLLTNKSFE